MAIGLSEHFNYKKLIRFVFPCIIMMIVNSIYSIVDGFFVSNFVGKNSFAAVNLVMPVLMALGAFGFMIGTGGSALVAFTLGEGKTEKANQIFSMLVFVVMAVGIIFAGIGIIFMTDIARLLGASDVIINDCIVYGRIILCALPLFMLQNGYQSFLVTAEKPKMGLVISIATGIANMILDFFLVYVFKLGIGGAAFATSFSQVIGGMIPTVYFFRKNSSLLRFVKFHFDGAALVKACTNGSSEMLTNLSASIVGMIYNFKLMEIAAENGVAAYGVVMYVCFIFMAVFFGYAVGVSPLVGYHCGAANHVELKNLLKKSLVLTALASLAMTVLAEVLAFPLAKIYVGYDETLCDMTVTAMRLYSVSFLICGFNIFGSAFFTGLNNGKVSALISFLRTLVIQVAAIFILPMILGINGIWLAVAAAEAVTLFVTLAMFLIHRRQYQY